LPHEPGRHRLVLRPSRARPRRGGRPAADPGKAHDPRHRDPAPAGPPLHHRLMTSSPPARSGATVGEAYVRLLGARGIDYVFANAGTDFAPVIEGWARARADGAAVPALVTVPHENVAVCMALGHWMVSGRMQAVMVHVNVGTANTLCGLLNATRVGAPMLLA